MSDKPRRLKQVIWSVGLVLVGAAVLAVMTFSRPPMARKQPKPSYPPVHVLKVQMASRQVTVTGEGTVKPRCESSLAAQVAGRVVWMSPSLVNGGRIDKGQPLLRIQSRDYKLLITQSLANVKEAETALQLREEEAKAARDEWRSLTRSNPKASKEPPPLVAKKPQLLAALAVLEAAKARLKVTRLALERTQIKAPYDGLVASKLVDLGQYLRVGDKVATVFCTDAVEIVVYLESDDLAWVKVPGLTVGEVEGSPAKVIVDFAGKRQEWPGRVVRSEGQVDERTRLMPVVVRVDKPYQSLPPLAVGLFARVVIDGRNLEQAALLPRAALRPNRVVWVVDAEGALRFRKVDVAYFQQDKVLIRSGLKQGDLVVVSPLGEVTDGMRVRPRTRNPESKS